MGGVMKYNSLFIAVCMMSLVWSAGVLGDDVTTVRDILEKCGMSGITVEDVAVIEDGQVVSLNLNNKDISKDGISVLPPDIGKLASLREFSCTDNVIETLPAEIGSCVSLQKINCSSNRIAAIPPEIGNLTNLTHLDVRHNSISVVPAEIKNCINLQYLWLWGNKITVFEPAILKLPKLRELYLKDNRLTTLPPEIIKKKFEYIDFLGNKLCNLPPKIDAWAKKIDNQYKSAQRCN